MGQQRTDEDEIVGVRKPVRSGVSVADKRLRPELAGTKPGGLGVGVGGRQLGRLNPRYEVAHDPTVAAGQIETRADIPPRTIRACKRFLDIAKRASPALDVTPDLLWSIRPQHQVIDVDATRDA